jgi:hypothetical protein
LPSQINASNSGFGGIVSTGDSSGVLQLQTVGTTAITVDTSQNTTLAGKLTTASSGIQFSDGSTQTAAASPYVLKNRIINGDMRIDQRNAGASVNASNGTYTLDRWACGGAVSNKFTVQQNAGSVTSPVGFNNYLGCTSSSAYSVPSGENYGMQQSIEGFNFADLGWGTANAKTVTLSFWVRSSLTGTFGGGFTNSAYDYSYVFSYSILTANTWTQISVTIAGPTSGTWIGATNGVGARVVFSLGTGSSRVTTAGSWVAGYYASVTGETQIVATNGATLYITGVQLEIGTSATPFERRLYNQELANCQRYALMIKNGTTSIDRFGLGSTVNSTTVQLLIQHPVALRAAPTLTTTGTASDYSVYSTAVTTCNAAPTLGEGSQFNSRYNFVTAGGLTGGQVAQCQGANTNAYLLLSAEL